MIVLYSIFFFNGINFNKFVAVLSLFIVKKGSEKPGSTEKDKEVLSKKTETVPKKQNDTVESLSKKKRYKSV